MRGLIEVNARHRFVPLVVARSDEERVVWDRRAIETHVGARDLTFEAVHRDVRRNRADAFPLRPVLRALTGAAPRQRRAGNGAVATSNRDEIVRADLARPEARRGVVVAIDEDVEPIEARGVAEGKARDANGETQEPILLKRRIAGESDI